MGGGTKRATHGGGDDCHMRTRSPMQVALLLAFQLLGLAQAPPATVQPSPQPLYQVTIIARTTKAINYGYLSSPTRIGFQGTPVAAAAKGVATVEPRRGSTLLNIRLEDLPAPGRYGAQYLTYVVW